MQTNKTCRHATCLLLGIFSGMVNMGKGRFSKLCYKFHTSIPGRYMSYTNNVTGFNVWSKLTGIWSRWKNLLETTLEIYAGKWMRVKWGSLKAALLKSFICANFHIYHPKGKKKRIIFLHWVVLHEMKPWRYMYFLYHEQLHVWEWVALGAETPCKFPKIV